MTNKFKREGGSKNVMTEELKRKGGGVNDIMRNGGKHKSHK